MATLDVIVPVYDGVREVRACLDSLFAADNLTTCDIVVIHDAGPSPEIAALLREHAHEGRITLLENAENLGFVRTANRGMALHGDRDVVLLNSDTTVHGNWLDRLVAHATRAADVGTVTPFSNNAEICSFPRLCRSNPVTPALSPGAIDAAVAGCLAGRSVDIPTAVGFCMYIRRACLQQVGLFDEETFGLGYGEENDFCMRARRLGWRHLLAADCFVEHVGGVSFSERKQALVARAMEVLDRRYPEYHGQVAEWIAADPPYALRCKGQLEILRADARQKVLAVTHHMGGGTMKHVCELADATDARALLITLKPFRGSVVRVTLGVDEDLPGLNFDWADPAQRDALVRFLVYLGVTRVHIHHLMNLEDMLPALLDMLGLPYDVTLHDFFLIDGNPTLTDESGLFQPTRSLRGAGCNSARVMIDESALQAWQEAQGALLSGAERVFAPSRAALELYAQVYSLPNAVVTGHTDMIGVDNLPVAAAAPRDSSRSPFRVLVLGALGIEKGALLLESVALLARRRRRPLEFVLLGYALRELAAVDTLGAYRDEDLDRRIAEQDPDLIWFPCRWPETYSYTLSAALRAGRPLLVPDIGSFPERVAGRPLTWVQPYASDQHAYLGCIEEIRDTLQARTGQSPTPWKPPVIGDFRYDTGYDGATDLSVTEVVFTLADVSSQLAGGDEQRAEGRRLWLLRILLRLKRHPALTWLARLLPLRWQRAVKRRLSSRPLHDISQG